MTLFSFGGLSDGWDWDEFYSYFAVYGIHLLMGLLLSAVTVFRREMSCNRVFHDEEEEEKSLMSMPEDSFISDAMGEETEELLESAGNFCSCHPIVHFASLWLDSIPEKDDEEPAIKLRFDHVTPADLLDRVGNFYSGEPIVAAVAHFLQDTHHKAPKQVSRQYDPFTSVLPPDVHVHIASFLHPRDVVSLSCVSRSYRAVVDDSETSKAIWNTLFKRDYDWVLSKWSPGKQAMQRSVRAGGPLKVDKDFYFRFGETYLNYILAGRSTSLDCMVGLHGHVFDITSFLDAHPGSPDTLMVYAGRNCTSFFEDMGHSLVARRLARKLCVLVDLSQLTSEGWGLRPTAATVFDLEDDDVPVPSSFPGLAENLLLDRRHRRKGGTLKRIVVALDAERAVVERQLEAQFSGDAAVLGSVNPFYDPIRRQWRFWYLNSTLNPVFGPV